MLSSRQGVTNATARQCNALYLPRNAGASKAYQLLLAPQSPLPPAISFFVSPIAFLAPVLYQGAGALVHQP